MENNRLFLNLWEKRLNVAQTGHYIAAEHLGRWHLGIGAVLVVSSTFVSAFHFSDTMNETVTWIVRAVGLLAACLASVQTFTRQSERAELHRMKATKYGCLKRKIELFEHCLNDHDDYIFNKFAEDIVREWNAIAEESPVTPQRIREKAASIRESDKTPDVQQMS